MRFRCFWLGSFLGLFLQNAILFENFILDYKELEFTKEVFLPAFIEIYKRFGIKPLIVALEPTNLEWEIFWMCHPFESKKVVDGRLKSEIIGQPSTVHF